MIYDYSCPSCEKEYSVIKSVVEYAGDDRCPECSTIGQRLYRTAPLGSVKNFDAAFYPALGKGFHTKRELKYHLDSKNLVEVGNDFSGPDSMQKHFEKAREEKRLKSWDDIKI